MNGPITNFELGKMLHREYEMEASRNWGQGETGPDKPGPARIYKLALAFSGITLTVFLLVQVLPL